MVFVYKPSENVKKKVIEYYQDMKKATPPPYSVFQAMEADTTVTLYTSGKLMFQGISADVDFDIWAALEKRFNNRDIYSELKTKDNKKDKKNDKEEKNYDYLKKISTMGSDEVGTGDYFGPIVVTASYVSKENISFLEELKVGDSKKITDERIMEIGPVLMRKIPYSTILLSNEEYNKSTDYNMNKMKAILHNKVLLSLADKIQVKPERTVVDQFVFSTKYFEYLVDSPNVYRDIFFLTKSEDKVYSVAVASIISRYLFLTKMKEIGDNYNKVIPLGAGVIVDEFAKELVKEFGEDVLKSITKYNFKNTQKILG